MAKAKAKTQKKPVKAKPSTKKPQGPAKAKAPAKKAGKPVGASKAPSSKGKKAATKPAPKKKTGPQPKKAATKPAPKKAAKAPAPKPKVAAKKPVPSAPKAAAKPAPAAKSAPVTKPAATPKAAPMAPVAAKPSPEKPPPASGPTDGGTVETAPKPAKAHAAKKEPAAKGPIIAVMTGLDPLGAPARTLKRAQKERFMLEFYMNATPGSLYDMLSTPSGLSEWFCDDVDVRGDQFTFRWGNDDQTAQCLSRKFGELMRFQWEDDEDQGSFFELRIRVDPMTNETCLVVTDHAWPKDMEEAKALWGSQIHALQRVLGA